MMHASLGLGGAGMFPLFFIGGFGRLAIFAGVFLLLAWAIKYLKAEKLKRLALWCIGLGLLASIVASIFGAAMGKQIRGYKDANWMMKLESEKVAQ